MIFKIAFFIVVLSNVELIKSVDVTKTVHDLNIVTSNPPFDPKIYENVLDPELCAKQLNYLVSNDTLLLVSFLESGIRIPKGLTQGNFQDLGNYHQCLGINREVGNMAIEGKYCRLNIPLQQDFITNMMDIREIPRFDEKTYRNIKYYEKLLHDTNVLVGIDSGDRSKYGQRTLDIDFDAIQIEVAICIPKPCSVKESIRSLLNTTSFKYEESFCRFKNDKPWTPGLYVAFGIFGLIGLLTILSTSYDVWNTIIRKRDAKSVSRICRSFSVYTNTKRLTTFVSNPGAIECIDGIRAISMMWVVIGHCFSTTSPILNMVEAMEWALGFGSIWLTAAPIVVDTFFMISGFLAVYTTYGKLSNTNLLKRLHIFYLTRILRMFPLLALCALLQATIFHYIADGPNWSIVGEMTEACRVNWWSTLLYVQNYVHPMCVYQTWYLAIDMQLHILSPLILFWVLSSNKKLAWISLIAVVLASITASSTFNFINDFPVSTLVPTSLDDSLRYYRMYYMNTLTRCSPFFVGMLFGFLVHVWRDNKVKLRKITVLILWLCTLALLFVTLYATTPMKDFSWDNQLADNFVNSLMRPGWAVGLGLMILLCAAGHGGLINWFLSHQIWKLPSRLSFAIYLFHYPIQVMIASSYTEPVYFSVGKFIYLFIAQFAIAFAVSFVLTLLVDSPVSTLFKVLLGGDSQSASLKNTKMEVQEAFPGLTLVRSTTNTEDGEGRTVNINFQNWTTTTLTTCTFNFYLNR